MIKPSTRIRIKKAIRDLLAGVIKKYDPNHSSYVLSKPSKVAKDGGLNPFHQAILAPGTIRLSRFERSFSTTLGSMFEVTAELIGEQNFAESKRRLDVVGHMSNAARAGIDGIVDAIRTDKFKGRYSDYVDMIVSSFHAKQIRQSVQADLYLRDHQNNELFFEMKSPKPNLDQCISVTRKFLEIHAIRRSGPPKVRTYYAMSYNPFGTRQAYKWSISRNYLDLDTQVLLGPEFWNLLGGNGTYEEVLEIFSEVGSEHRTTLLRILK